MTVTNATKMMRLVGEVVEIKDPMVNGVLLRSFMIARISFNTLKPLPTGCRVPRKNSPKSWVMFRYEKLQGFTMHVESLDMNKRIVELSCVQWFMVC